MLASSVAGARRKRDGIAPACGRNASGGARGVVWGAQAASLQQSAAAPTAPKKFTTTYCDWVAASCREQQASSLCSPERGNVLAKR